MYGVSCQYGQIPSNEIISNECCIDTSRTQIEILVIFLHRVSVWVLKRSEKTLTMMTKEDPRHLLFDLFGLN